MVKENYFVIQEKRDFDWYDVGIKCEDLNEAINAFEYYERKFYARNDGTIFSASDFYRIVKRTDEVIIVD